MTTKRTLSELLLGGPGHDGYAYQADVYCVDCGQEIIRDLYEENYSALVDEQGEFVRDSERAPQPIFFGESDYAQHCAYCGEYLYGSEPEDEDESEDEEYDDPDQLDLDLASTSHVGPTRFERIAAWFTWQRRLALIAIIVFYLAVVTFAGGDPLDRLVIELVKGGH